MRLNDKFWFNIMAGNAGYTEEESSSVWESLNKTQLDFFEDLCEYFYREGYKACEEDRIC